MLDEAYLEQCAAILAEQGVELTEEQRTFVRNKKFTKYQIMTRVGTIISILLFVVLGFCIEVIF